VQINLKSNVRCSSNTSGAHTAWIQLSDVKTRTSKLPKSNTRQAFPPIFEHKPLPKPKMADASGSLLTGVAIGVAASVSVGSLAWLLCCRNASTVGKSSQSKLELTESKLGGYMVGSMVSTAIAIGDELNLFHKLYECTSPVTSQQFADKTGLNERW
jgi:hypothetical protein